MLRRRLDANSEQLVCDDRGVSYEVTGGIARLLPSQERPLIDHQPAQPRPPSDPAQCS